MSQVNFLNFEKRIRDCQPPAPAPQWIPATEQRLEITSSAHRRLTYFRGSAIGAPVEEGGSAYLRGRAVSAPVKEGGSAYLRGRAVCPPVEEGGSAYLRGRAVGAPVEEGDGVAVVLP